MTPDTSRRVAPPLSLVLALLLVASAWAAAVVIVEDWTKLKLGAKGDRKSTRLNSSH